MPKTNKKGVPSQTHSGKGGTNGKDNQNATKGGSRGAQNSTQDSRNKPTCSESGKPANHERQVKTHQDMAWYSYHKQLLDAVATVSLNRYRGTELAVQANPGIQGMGQSKITEEPTINVLKLVPTGGGSSGNLKVAAINLYQWVRHANSGSRNYESADLMMYVLAIKEVLSYFGWVYRLLDFLYKYEANDPAVPATLIAAMLNAAGFMSAGATFLDQVKSLVTDRYNMVARINALVNSLNTLAFPSDIPLFTRAFWMYRHVFSQDTTFKKTYYMYNPNHFMKYSPTLLDTGGCLTNMKYITPTTEGSERLSDMIISIGEVLINALIYDEDTGIISGDIRKAYGPEQLMAVPLYDVLNVSADVHDVSEVAIQFHGARLYYAGYDIVNKSQSADQLTIHQSNGNIIDASVTTPESSTNSDKPGYPIGYILDLNTNAATTDLVVEATRLTYCITPGGTNQSYDNFKVACDFWLPVQLVCYSNYLTDDGVAIASSIFTNGSITGGAATPIEFTFSQELPILPHYAMPLKVYARNKIAIVSGDTYPVTVSHVYGLRNNWVHISEDFLARLHTACVQSQLGVPKIK